MIVLDLEIQSPEQQILVRCGQLQRARRPQIAQWNSGVARSAHN